MKTKVIVSFVAVLAILFCLSSTSLEAKTHVSFHVGAMCAPQPHVYEYHTVHHYSSYHPEPVGFYTYHAPQPVYYVQPSRTVYREVYVTQPDPFYSGCSFFFGDYR